MKQHGSLQSSGKNTMRHYRCQHAARPVAGAKRPSRAGAGAAPAPTAAPSILLRLLRAFLVTSCFAYAAVAAPARGQPTQEEVFRSIGQNVNDRVDSRRLLALVLSIGGVVALLVVLSHGKRRGGRPKVLDHPGRLLKEAMKAVSLKPAELKQLKALVQEARSRDENGPTSPLTLLLCPSVLAREAQRNPRKVNRKVLGGLMKRMGLVRAA